MTSLEPFFTRDGERFIPGPYCRGPWNPQSLNGRVIAGLIGGATELKHAAPGFRPARMTVDIYRMPGFAPVEIATRVVHQGRRVMVVDADFISDGKPMARGTFQFLAEGENAPNKVWSPPGWDAPDPETVATFDPPRKDMAGIWETRPFEGEFGAANPRKLWSREIRPLIEGVPLTPFQRLALAVDFTNPFSNAGVGGLGYINTDVTLYLHRLPVGEYIGFETLSHHAADGIANGMVLLHDTQGPIGHGAVASLAHVQRPG